MPVWQGTPKAEQKFSKIRSLRWIWAGIPRPNDGYSPCFAGNSQSMCLHLSFLNDARRILGRGGAEGAPNDTHIA